MLRPFWSYYGSKWQIAGLYPRPLYGTVIEPFAGSACYALRYPDRRVTLCDADPVVAGIWRYLISAKESEVLALPTDIEHVDQLADRVPQEARWLVGFWLGRGRMRPALKASAWARSHVSEAESRARFWGPAARDRIARQLSAIRHWRIIEGRAQDLANTDATWFIDAPYQGRPGRPYRVGSRQIDFGALGEWCRSRRGQIIVCEQSGADWLPFVPLVRAHRRSGTRTEVIWTPVPRAGEQLSLMSAAPAA